MDSRCTPERIGSTHVPDQIASLSIDLRPGHADGFSIASSIGKPGDASESQSPAEQCEVSLASPTRFSIAIPKTVGPDLSVVAAAADASERRAAGAEQDSQERVSYVSEMPIAVVRKNL